MNEWQIEKENHISASIVNILRKKMARFIDYDAEFSDHYKHADPLTRLCLLGLGSEPLGLVYIPGLKPPMDYYGSLISGAGSSSKWMNLRDAVEDAESCYEAASNKTITGIVLKSGNNLCIITRSDAVEAIEDMPFLRMRLGDETYRMFMVSEYIKSRDNCKISGMF